jgi:hypothetical protein
MGVEILLLYAALMLVLGPGLMLYGAVIIVRQRVRLSRGKVLNGGTAVIAGIATTLVGAAFTSFLWEMARFFPH